MNIDVMIAAIAIVVLVVQVLMLYLIFWDLEKVRKLLEEEASSQRPVGTEILNQLMKIRIVLEREISQRQTESDERKG